MLIEEPIDAVALSRDGNYSSFLAEALFDFLAIDDLCLILRAFFTGLLEEVFS